MIPIDHNRLESFHSYYTELRKWDSLPTDTRCRILAELLSAINPHVWRVVGCTYEALEVFTENDFQYRPRLGVNRGHLTKRITTMRHLIEHEYSDPKAWFNYYYQRDKTVLMTASENRRCDNKTNPVQLAEGTDYIKINDLDLFPDGNYCWRHGQKEINWLREQAALYLPR